jgi:hypothetical protein
MIRNPFTNEGGLICSCEGDNLGVSMNGLVQAITLLRRSRATKEDPKSVRRHVYNRTKMDPLSMGFTERLAEDTNTRSFCAIAGFVQQL